MTATDQEIRTIAAWADAVLFGAAPSHESRLGAPPFSFQYGNDSSSALLARWKTTRSREMTVAGDHYRQRWQDIETSLEVEWDATVYSKHSSIAYSLRFTNHGSSSTPILTDVLPLDLRISCEAQEKIFLHTSRGGVSSPEDYKPECAELVERDRVRISAANGRSSNAQMPWFNLQWPDGGMVGAIGWSGQWKADFERTGQIRVRAGMEDCRIALDPGESIRTPRIALTYWMGSDRYRGYNLWRRVMLDHFLPRIDGQPVTPLVAKPTPYDELNVDTWESTHSEANQLETIEAASQLGVELYWLDAYWFKGFYPRGLGNWQFPIMGTVRDSFPNGLRPLAEAAHRRGMKFILWFAPESVYPGTYIDYEKPSWRIRLPEQVPALFNLAVPEASEWMTRYIVENLREFDVDICRIDSTFDPLAYWRAADAPDRKGMTEIRYIEALYRMWEDVVASKPGMWIDSCAGGGRRIDLETCSRSLTLWRSDFNDTPKRQVEEIGAISDQVMTMGLSLYVPLHSGPIWRAEPYYWRSAVAAGINIYWDLRRDKQTGEYKYDRDLLRKAIQEYKLLRPLFAGDYFPLTDINARPNAWAAYEYIGPETGDGFALFFRRPDAPDARQEFQLYGLNPDRHYNATWYWSYDPGRTTLVSGSELARFTADIEEKPGSLLLRFEQVNS